MFSDPITAVMALILLAFAGTLAVFLRIWRELDLLHKAVREIKDHLQFYAVDSAQQNRDLANIVRELRGVMAKNSAEPDPAAECLGELLEKGLPNLAGQDARIDPLPADSHAALSADDDEEALFRRLGVAPADTSGESR